MIIWESLLLVINSRNPDPQREVTPGPDRPGSTTFPLEQVDALNPVNPVNLTDEFREASVWRHSNLFGSFLFKDNENHDFFLENYIFMERNCRMQPQGKADL